MCPLLRLRGRGHFSCGDAVRRGATECLVRAVYAPNRAEPLDVHVESAGGGDVRLRQDALALTATGSLAECRMPSARVPLDWHAPYCRD